ncbi:hypothetical protein O3P69_002206 [Scylla paramamosain]|uniref:Uncharacterized protein n=1 Tax=Scylla paramamosain TaxID=85552 RepID=A0AAW0V5N3_SCYPA
MVRRHRPGTLKLFHHCTVLQHRNTSTAMISELQVIAVPLSSAATSLPPWRGVEAGRWCSWCGGWEASASLVVIVAAVCTRKGRRAIHGYSLRSLHGRDGGGGVTDSAWILKRDGYENGGGDEILEVACFSSPVLFSYLYRPCSPCPSPACPL